MSPNSKIPHNQEEVVSRLLECFPELPGQLQKTARYIVDHPHEVGVQSMRTLATAAKVHPNSFVRLARHIGFDGYEAMRERFRDFVRSGAGSSRDRAEWLQDMARKGGASEILGEMASSTLTNLEQMAQQQDINKLEKAVQWMMVADRVYVLGVGAGYALAYTFWYVARMIGDHFILIPRHGSLPMDDITSIGKKDVLLAMTFQPYRSDIIRTLQFANDQGARTIGLSDSPAAVVYREAGLGLHAPTPTPQVFHANSAVVALLETLCALLVAEGGEKAVRHIEDFTNLRWESGVYEP
jgi:DNA-binding MurR/RpiR family transcriptional regulator